jgi:uncharacterized protein YijF (DUF1287 family)
MKKIVLFLIVLLIVIGFTGCMKWFQRGGSIGIIGGADGPTAIFVSPRTSPSKKKIIIEQIISSTDKDEDGISDTEDILQGARLDIKNKPRYKDAYYKGGYPPDDEGVCTDVIWRAFKDAGYLLKDMVDEDIRNNVELYPRVEGKPDPNIDFRRIKNLRVFFDRHATVLTTEIKPGDEENLKEWQPGDIVVFDDPMEHIAIVSDQRNEDGIPLMIHNAGPYTQENDMLMYWKENYSPIIGHYRFPADE